MAAVSVNKCSVCIEHNSDFREAAEAPASKIIAGMWGRAIRALAERSPESPASLLGRLGVSETDRTAQDELIPLMQMASREDVQIAPSRDDSGVYFLSLAGEAKPFGVFKVGTRRMQVETLARRIAHTVGLEQHIVPKVFCSIQNPALPSDDEMTEELWNGNVKIYLKPEGRTTTLTGTLEPFLRANEKIVPDDLASMTFLAFLLGLRDAKLDGRAGCRFFDVEDIMQLRLMPGPGTSPNKAVAATHLPYLAEPLAKEPMSREKLIELSKRVNEIAEMLPKILPELENERVFFADHPSESLMAFDEDQKIPSADKGKNRGIDHGGFRVKTVKQVKIMEDHPNIDIAKTDRLLCEKQLVAFVERVECVKRFIDRCVETNSFLPSSLDLIKNADQMYGAHSKAIDGRNSRLSMSAPDLIGVRSPSQTGSPLSEEDRQAILTTRDTPSPALRSVSRTSPSPHPFGSTDELISLLSRRLSFESAPEFSE